MSLKKFIVDLSEEERLVCQEVIKKLKGTSQKVKRANILLKADKGWTDTKIAEALDCRVNTGGKDHCHATGRFAKRIRKVDFAAVGKKDCRTRDRTSDQLSDGGADAKKNKMNTRRNLEYWVIPPEADAEFAAHMEDVLDVYSRTYDAKVPVLCMDEQPVQLVQETREPIPATAKHPKRIDYEYMRAGVANIFMFAEPLANWRQVSVRTQKTKVDWALEMGTLLEGRYKDCKKVIIVCDNLNTHTIGAFYTAFKPARARSFVGRIEFHYTPKHGSWLNIAENELSCVTTQCVAGRRIGSEAALREETTAWYEDINSIQRGVDWQMKIDDARIKLKTIYPQIKV